MGHVLHPGFQHTPRIFLIHLISILSPIKNSISSSEIPICSAAIRSDSALLISRPLQNWMMAARSSKSSCLSSVKAVHPGHAPAQYRPETSALVGKRFRCVRRQCRSICALAQCLFLSAIGNRPLGNLQNLCCAHLTALSLIHLRTDSGARSNICFAAAMPIVDFQKTKHDRQ